MKNKQAFIYFGASVKNIAILLLGGFIAGACNGLLGAGGGIVLVLVFSALLPKNDESSRSIYANALLVMLPLSCLTLYRYVAGGDLALENGGGGGVSLILGAIFGGVLGGIFLGRFKTRFLNKLFALLTLISGIIMLTR